MRALAVALILLVGTHGVGAATLEEDVQRYVEIFKGDKSLHSDAADTFVWMGLSDTRLFDIIEQRVLDEHQVARNERAEKNRVARYIRALGFSGQPKYQATIARFQGDRVYERYSIAALEDLEQYQRWNPIIANRASFDPKHSDDVNRVMNMLRADDLLLKRLGAKRIFFQHKEEVLLDLLAKELSASYMTIDPQHDNAIAWMAKALASSKQEKYKPVLEEVAATAKEPKIRRHAAKWLSSYYR